MGWRAKEIAKTTRAFHRRQIRERCARADIGSETYIHPALAHHAAARVDENAIVAVRVDLLHLFDEFGLGHLGDRGLRWKYRRI